MSDPYADAIKELTERDGCAPTRVEVAAHLGVSRQACARVYRDRGWPVVSTSQKNRALRSLEDEAALSRLDGDEREVVEMTRRPGRRLAEILESKRMDLGAFGLKCGLGQDRRRAAGQIRKYTHPPVGGRAKVPKMETLARWCRVLGVRWGTFFEE